MSYTPPAGNAVELPFLNGTYTAPSGNAVALDLGTGSVLTVAGVGVGVIDLTADAVGFSTPDPVTGDAVAAIELTASGEGVRGTGGTAAGMIQLTADGSGEALAGTEAKCAALLHYEGTTGVQGPFIDETGKVWTVSGAPVFTTNHVVGDTGIQLSVAGPDYLTTPFHQDFNFGPNDFAIQTWIRPGANTAHQPIIANTDEYGSANGRWEIRIISTSGFPATVYAYFVSTTGFDYSLTADAAVGYLTDHFISVQRKDLALTLEVDGVVKDTKALASADLVFGAQDHPLYIGQANGSTFHGMLDETRILNGVAPDTTLAEAQAGFTLQSDMPVVSVAGDGVGVIELTGDGVGETVIIVAGDGAGVIALTGAGTGTANETTDVVGDGSAIIMTASGNVVVGCAGVASAELLTASGSGAVSSFAVGSGTISLSANGTGVIGYSADASGVIELFGLGVGNCFAQVVGDGAAYLLYAEGDGFVPREEEDFDVLFVRTSLPRFEVRT